MAFRDWPSKIGSVSGNVLVIAVILALLFLVWLYPNNEAAKRIIDSLWPVWDAALALVLGALAGWQSGKSSGNTVVQTQRPEMQREFVDHMVANYDIEPRQP